MHANAQKVPERKKITLSEANAQGDPQIGLPFVFLIENVQALQQQILIQNNLPLA